MLTPRYAATLEAVVERKPNNQIMKTKSNGKGQESLASASGSADLADKIARDIFAEGDERTPCQRIQFMGGTYPDREENNGGYCEIALANALRKILARHLPNKKLTDRGASLLTWEVSDERPHTPVNKQARSLRPLR